MAGLDPAMRFFPGCPITETWSLSYLASSSLRDLRVVAVAPIGCEAQYRAAPCGWRRELSSGRTFYRLSRTTNTADAGRQCWPHRLAVSAYRRQIGSRPDKAIGTMSMTQ